MLATAFRELSFTHGPAIIAVGSVQSQHSMGGNGEEKHRVCARGLCGPRAGSNFSWIAGSHPAAAQLFAAGCQSGEALHGPMGRKGRKGVEGAHQGPGVPVDAARRQSGATAHPGAGRRGGRGLDAAGFSRPV